MACRSPPMSAATRSPAAVSRTASVTSAPAPLSARAVSIPIPEAPPVTIARLPVRSMPATTSAAVDSKEKGVVMRVTLSSLRRAAAALKRSLAPGCDSTQETAA